MNTLSPNQIKIGLAVVGLSSAHVSKEMGVHRNTINKLRRGDKTTYRIRKKASKYIALNGVEFDGNFVFVPSLAGEVKVCRQARRKLVNFYSKVMTAVKESDIDPKA